LTELTQQYGFWVVGDVPDAMMLTELVSKLRAFGEETNDEYYIHSLKIARKPESVNDFDPLAQRAYTAIKAVISKERYR
jgi:hypothetical protein